MCVFACLAVCFVLVVVRGWLSHIVIQRVFARRMAIGVLLLLLLLALLLLFWWRSVVGGHILSFNGRPPREWRYVYCYCFVVVAVVDVVLVAVRGW